MEGHGQRNALSVLSSIWLAVKALIHLQLLKAGQRSSTALTFKTSEAASPPTTCTTSVTGVRLFCTDRPIVALSTTEGMKHEGNCNHNEEEKPRVGMRPPIKQAPTSNQRQWPLQLRLRIHLSVAAKCGSMGKICPHVQAVLEPLKRPVR
ncbi:hypothetical protein TcWFU_002704 [Taenia crassiceps]|uniref:Secreted protein n=1 Tax=Taenia crassiceps TaxID=6207 RepID=A0ABR4Q0E7_9CEST